MSAGRQLAMMLFSLSCARKTPKHMRKLSYYLMGQHHKSFKTKTRNCKGMRATATKYGKGRHVLRESAGADWRKGTASLSLQSMWHPPARLMTTSGQSCATSRSVSCRCIWLRYLLPSLFFRACFSLLPACVHGSGIRFLPLLHILLPVLAVLFPLLPALLPLCPADVHGSGACFFLLFISRFLFLQPSVPELLYCSWLLVL